MRKLSDTIARLSAYRTQLGAGAGVDAPGRLGTLPEFGSNPGALLARTHLPPELPAGAPLVVVLHGCTQTASGYDLGSGWSTLADRDGFALLFPEQQRANNANLCFNWFEPGDTQRGRGEALSISRMIETMITRHGLDRRRVFITGLSAGGAMAAVMLATYPELFAGGAIIAGLPYGVAATIPEAFDRMRAHGLPGEKRLQDLVRSASRHEGAWPTISIWQGSADRTVSPANAAALITQWRGVHSLRSEPSASEVVDGQRRRVWRDAGGRDLVEEYSIAGMGHGTPIAGDVIGRPGPYMLAAGISSTQRIAGFWGLAADEAGKARPEVKTPAVPLPVQEPAMAAGPARQELERPRETNKWAAPPAAAGVRKIIEDALRSAGLMR
ncbi:esterase, PHB depolymerase family [Bosea sp. CRIB-10]|uniref:extracellular catalytic domain type 1 short-chain-length polyhydroxyalkanoate depolymerase n=1 Tax=Bosea sp. CRIB-10 TaxID=378404 RepID=UPI0008E1DA5B|nr:PHB depolymerase family esterase [Bosea sp. CRIB-10]SFC41991.1 esterase, PHB depolymerase family [Bosea sp. CRIB-10]